MRYDFSSIKTSHVYKNIKKYYYLIFKGMKKAKALGKYLSSLVTPPFLPNTCNFTYESDWF
jgi:hypothetical protein